MPADAAHAALDPEARQLLQELASARRPSVRLLPIEAARRQFDATFAGMPRQPVSSVADLEIDLPGRVRIWARCYRPRKGHLPAIVYLHGGGWLIGGSDSHDAICRALANRAGAVVVSVAYRRAPEHPFPAAAQDAYGALCWVAEHADSLGSDPGRVACCGDSAGGNLVLAAVRLCAERGGPMPAQQTLVYPVTTTDLQTGFDAAYDGIMLDLDEMRWHQRHYLPDAGQRSHPLASPLEHPVPPGLPPALIAVAGCDPLHAQAECYAEHLERAGVPTDVVTFSGMPHGFFQFPGVLSAADEAVRVVAGAMQEAWNAKLRRPDSA